MKSLLFIGGTRFFGKEVIKELIRRGQYEITTLTRGSSPPLEFEKHVTFMNCDRGDSKALKSVLQDKKFDIVVDNVAYMGGPDVKAVLDVLNGRIEHYLLCSSGAVYPSFGTHEWKEPEATLEPIEAQGVYANNKRGAEKQLLSYANVPYTIYRPTVVQGAGDPTKRIHYFIDKILRQENFYIPENVFFKHVYSIDLALAITGIIELPEPKT